MKSKDIMKKSINSSILIIGMARSGTTLVSHLLGLLPETHLEIEPHVLWKCGDFKFLHDSDCKRKSKDIMWIHRKLMSAVPEGKILVEKSPVNCLRPHTVHSVFPEAKIIYVERDPVRCIYSNISRSLKRDSFKLSIILKKYFLYTGSDDLEGSIGKRKIYQQLRFTDLSAFCLYCLKMIWIRNVKKKLPFGPKIKNFEAIVKNKGILAYHVDVFKEAERCKSVFEKKYGNRISFFKMEDLQTKPVEIQKLYDFCGFKKELKAIEVFFKTLNVKKAESAIQKSELDEQISALLDESQK